MFLWILEINKTNESQEFIEIKNTNWIAMNVNFLQCFPIPCYLFFQLLPTYYYIMKVRKKVIISWLNNEYQKGKF